MKKGNLYTGSIVNGHYNQSRVEHVTILLLEDVEIAKFDREIKVLKTVTKNKEVISSTITKVSVGWLCLLSKEFRKEFGIKE